MNKGLYTRYWFYYTAADLLGLFTGLVIYGVFLFPNQIFDVFRLAPDTHTLATTSGAVLYIWYIKAFYLPLILLTFICFIKSTRKFSAYYSTHRLITLLLYFGILASLVSIEDGYQFYIPVGCVLFFNIVAFYLLESREVEIA